MRKSMEQLRADVSEAVAKHNRGELSTKQLDAIVSTAESDASALKRANRLRHGAAGGTVTKGADGPRPIGGAAPFRFAEGDLRALHDAATHQGTLAIKGAEPGSIRTKADTFSNSSLIGQLPAELFPSVVGQAHENRLATLLPAQGTGAPSLEFIRHSGTTGAPDFTSEGAEKPELIFETDTLTATVQKLAARTAFSYEALSDFGTWVDYIQNELLRQLTDKENSALLYRDETGFEGLSNVSGIVKTTAPTGANPLDVIEATIAKLRSGAALAVPTVAVTSPNTFSAIRRTKDDRGQYLLEPDPRVAEAQSIWGINTVVTTAVTDGELYLIDATKFGFVVAREGITVRTSSGGDSFRANLTDIVAELRFSLAVTRPAAVAQIKSLPHSTTISAPSGS